MVRLLCTLAVLFITLNAHAADDLAGTWSSDQVTVRLKKTKAGWNGTYVMSSEEGTLEVEPMMGGILGRFSSGGHQGIIAGRRYDDVLNIAFDGKPYNLRRGMAKGAPTRVAKTAQVGRGARHQSARGWSIEVPAGFSVTSDSGDRVTLEGNECAVVVALRQEINETVANQWLTASSDLGDGTFKPSGKPRAVKHASHKALIVEGSVSRMFGMSSTAGAAGVVHQQAGASIAVMGTGAAEGGERIVAVVESILKSTRLPEPSKAALAASRNAAERAKGPTKGAARMRGPYCKPSGGYTSAGSWSVTRKMTFDGKGTVAWGGASFYSSNNGNIAAGQGSAKDLGTYSVEGDTISIRWDDGNTMKCTSNAENRGVITEMNCDGKLWWPDGCD